MFWNCKRNGMYNFHISEEILVEDLGHMLWVPGSRNAPDKKKERKKNNNGQKRYAL